jgi:hypothetical protein
LIYFDQRIQQMTRVAHIKRSPDKPRHGTQLPLPKLGLTGRPAPLLLEEKGLGDEVHATKERPEDEVHATKERPEDDSIEYCVLRRNDC